MKKVAYISARREIATPVIRAVTDAVQACGGLVVRLGDSFGLSAFANGLSQFLQSVDVVIAHVSQLNPNLLYEIGVAHGLGKPVIFVAPASLNLPLDLRGKRMISYEEKPEIAKLTFALKQWLQELDREVSPEPQTEISQLPTRNLFHHTMEDFERAVGQALSSVPGWEVQASSTENRSGAFDFVIWNQHADPTLAALGNPIGVEVKSTAPRMETVRKLTEKTKKQGLKGLLLIVGNRLPQKLRRSMGSVGSRSGIVVIPLDVKDIESLNSSVDFTRLLQRSLIELRLT